MSDIVPEISERFIDFRKTMKLSQQVIATTTGLSRGYITQVETGRLNPSFKLLHQMLIHFDLSIDWLISGRGNMLVSKNRTTYEMIDEHYDLIDGLKQLETPKQSRIIEGILEIIKWIK